MMPLVFKLETSWELVLPVQRHAMFVQDLYAERGVDVVVN